MSYVWTNEKPTVPGWYWFKNTDARHHIRECIIEIVDYPGEMSSQWTVRGADINWSLGNMSGQWAGPIDEPKEA